MPLSALAFTLDGEEIIVVDDPTDITYVPTNPPPPTDHTPNNFPEPLTSEDSPPPVLHIPEDETSTTLLDLLEGSNIDQDNYSDYDQ